MTHSSLAGVLLLAGLAASSARAEPLLPQRSEQAHEGVRSCAGSTCHPDAYQTWERQDVHRDAYAALEKPLSRRIAWALGLKKPAHESPLCLDCHADFVPPERRGEKFALSDGVGCEACHGGAGSWLGPHQVAAPGADPLALGMYPTADPRKRAELCISCHLGTRDKFVTHRILGAGHPRMPFEVDNFSNEQPAHHDLRSDASPVALWAIGQAVLARESLLALADPKRGRDGIWPEFALFDCHACHHPMSQRSWLERPDLGLVQPGIAHFNDSSLLMLRHALVGVDPRLAEELRRGTRGVHAAVAAGGAQAAARRLAALVERALPAVERWIPDAASVKRIARSLTEEGIQGQYRDYAEAEQASLVVQTLTATLADMKAIDATTANAVSREAQAMLQGMREHFRPASLPPVLRRIQAQLR